MESDYAPSELGPLDRPDEPRLFPEDADQDPPDQQLQEPADDQPPSQHEADVWEAQLSKFHKASGHPSSRNLARMLLDAQLPLWKVKMGERFKCDICEEA